MLDFYFIRHGQTHWNVEKRLQGHTDIALNRCGREQISNYRLPFAWYELQWFCSPLLRAVETAKLLNVEAVITPDLIEMNWGDWEGKCISQLRQDSNQICAEQEARGLDLTPPQGESPRLVAQRVSDWALYLEALSTQLNAIENSPSDFGCVSHKGVIRAIYAMATNWDMKSKARDKLDFRCGQHFSFENGVWSVVELNIKLS